MSTQLQFTAIHMKLLILFFILIGFTIVFADYNEYSDYHEHYANQWAARIQGGRSVADKVAAEYDYINEGELLGFQDTYMFTKRDVPTRAKRDAYHHTRILIEDPRVEFADQQQIKTRVKRETDDPNDYQPILGSLLPRHHCKDNLFIDPLWKFQWYMCDRRTQNNLPVIDLNVAAAWLNHNVTGSGISVTILDDGLEWNHTDIYANHDPDASWDVNDNDPDPFPRYDRFNTNKHGTRCAGEVSMIANNTVCGVGVAYNSKIGGVRLLDGPVTDSIEAAAVGFNCTHVDIYSASWGPTDNGETLDGPGRLTSEAINRCINEGRDGKGVIYIWANGNGGIKNDNCNCDGYTSNIYTVSIGSVSQTGNFPWYGELCASTIACAYSGGPFTDQKINTIDLFNTCTNEHTGTSAAAPLAAGIVALMLEANQNLTWRDIQHIIVFTSENGPLEHNPGWLQNSIGLRYNLRFGFGLMNADTAVDAAKRWINVPKKSICTVHRNDSNVDRKLTSSNSFEVYFDAAVCPSNETTTVNYIEHVQIVFTMAYNRRGAVEVELFAPNGTQTVLLNSRNNDYSGSGFKKWTFTSMHMWGESPVGLWKLVVFDKSTENNHGNMSDAVLLIHGTSEIPNHMTDRFKFKKERKEIEPKDLKTGILEYIQKKMILLKSQFW